MKDDCTTNSHHITHTFLFKRLGECTFFNLFTNSPPSISPQTCECTFAAKRATIAASGEEVADVHSSKSTDATTRPTAGDTMSSCSTVEQVNDIDRAKRTVSTDGIH